jgi:hypothetical protein
MDTPAAAASPAGAPQDQARQDAFARLRTLFDQYGIPDLAQWAWGELTGLSGVSKSEDQVLLDMYDQPTFKQRFPYFDALRQAGLPAPTIAETLRTETEYKQLQRRFGVDPSNNPGDYVSLFTGQVSPSEFGKRLEDFFQVKNVWGPHMRAAFETHAGIPGVSDTDLYALMSGQKDDLAHQYAHATGTPVHVPNFREIEKRQGETAAGVREGPSFGAIQESIKQSEMEEKAFARTGGEIQGGIGETGEERILRERQTAI